MESFKKLFCIISITCSTSCISASKESVEESIMQLSDAAQKMQIDAQEVENVVQDALQDSEFDSDTQAYLITTLRFALHTAETLEDEELITTIERYLAELGGLEILTPPMTQYSQN